MKSNRDEIYNWRKQAFRIRQKSEIATSIPTDDFDENDVFYFNFSISLLMVFIGCISCLLMYNFNFISPNNDLKPIFSGPIYEKQDKTISKHSVLRKFVDYREGTVRTVTKDYQ